MKRILKLENDPVIISECWSYYKLSIVQEKPFFDLWLASHMKVYLKQNGIAVFGENGEIHPLSYYSDILTISDASIVAIKKDDIVQFLIDQINNNNYVIVYLNFERIEDINTTDFLHHETLIYGYDIETQEFIVPMLANGSFREARIGFKELAVAYDDVRIYYMDDASMLFTKRKYFDCITILKPKAEYENANVYYDFISKLKWEREGNVFNRQKYTGDFEDMEDYIYYTGITCMKYMAKFLARLMKSDEANEENLYICRKSCLKLYENQNIILRSMRWFEERIDPQNSILKSQSQKYEECCKRMYANVLLFDKYALTQKSNVLERIVDNLEQTYCQEKDILDVYIQEATDTYTRYLVNREYVRVQQD